MKTILSILFASLFIINSLGTSAEKLIRFEKNGKFGYKNEYGQIIIKAKFHVAYTDTITNIGFFMEPKSRRILCINNLGKFLFYTFNYDNGPDYPSEGLFRIVNKEGLIGYSDLSGNVVIAPIYKFAYPFKDGKAKVTSEGYAVQENEHVRWKGNNWYYILNPLKTK